MSNSVKVSLYAVLILIASVSGYFALSSFGQMMSRAGDRHSDLEQIEPERKLAETAEVDTATNALATNAPAATATNNAVSLTNAIPPVASNTISGPVSTATNALSSESATNAPASKPQARLGAGAVPKTTGHLGLWTALFIVSVIALGLLIASDVSHYFGNRALKVLYNDENVGSKDPDYENAEEVWANGDHLEAIKMMREYLARNPREQHVAIRIAEIYEKDLQNNLAAALEYEEVLKNKLAPERWGWAAVHLCNLYFKLNQEQKGFVLLRRIVKEYPNTAAAEKARKRLEQVDGSSDTDQITTDPQAPSGSPPPPAGPASHLPPGFRPKK